jgi:wyosine [tRNA(Phe)-imidazoG37] synthetase (radical SAM superfamily)
MSHVFGPVPSRRLGKSLGVDPIPFKTCNWNCVYCQLGRTTPLTNERKDYFAPERIVAEVNDALESKRRGDIDWVTFVGSGEPTLHASLGWMIRQVKAMTEIPVAVTTNCSLLYQPEVREELSAADAVLPSLDAGTDHLYRAINRPHPSCTFERLIGGLEVFRRTYPGKLWVEVMLVKGMNDSDAALEQIAALLTRIAPDGVHVSIPFRPPAEPWVEPPEAEVRARAVAILGERARMVAPVSGTFDLSRGSSVVDAAVEIMSRHPIAEKELMKALVRWTPGEVGRALSKLAADGRAQIVNRYGVRFWSYSGARYGERSRASSTVSGQR